jgi:hypothetical protein
VGEHPGREKTHTEMAATIPFVFSVSSFDKRKKELWTERGLSEDDADMIGRQQLSCLFEMPIGFVVGAILSMLLVR